MPRGVRLNPIAMLVVVLTDGGTMGDRRPRFGAPLIVTVALGLFACDRDAPDDALPACIEVDVATCSPQYPAEFHRVFTETLQPRCSMGASCHGQADVGGAQGGMLVTDIDATHAALVDGGFVVPGDPSCSPLMVRLNVDDELLRMPPGAQPLDVNVRCSIARWIADGAAR